MFMNCASLTEPPPALPATTLANNCCWYMFCNCSSLTAAPALPATTLTDYCYLSMFRGCSSLTAAPALPAEWLEHECYKEMFINSGVREISASFLDWGDGTGAWLDGVPAQGTFYCPSDLGSDFSIERGSGRCPAGWTVVNTDA